MKAIIQSADLRFRRWIRGRAPGNFRAVTTALCLAVGLAMLLAGCGLSSDPPSDYTEEGTATWYGKEFKGKPTASGEKFDPGKATAAHPRLAFGTVVRVTNLGNGRSVKVRINDNFPGGKGRIIDLSKSAFAEIADTDQGVVKVRLEVLRWPEGRRRFRN